MSVGDIRELYSYRGRSQRDGIDGRVRGLEVEGVNVDDALNPAIVPGIPVFRSQHPDDSNMLARDFATTPRGQNTLVTVSYAPAPFVGGSIPPVNQYEDGFLGMDASFDSEDVDIPLFQRTDVIFGEGESAVEKTVFEQREDVMAYRKKTPYYRVPVGIELDTQANLGTVIQLGKVINDQVGKIHTLFGEDLLFACEGLTQRGPTQFRAVYRWYTDPGVMDLLSVAQQGPQPGANLFQIGSTIYPYFNDPGSDFHEYLMPPFHGVRIDGDADPEMPPTVTYFERFARVPNGWQTLPGIA